MAEQAEVSVDPVRKLEQEVRHTSSTSSLTRRARALDIELAQLLGQADTIQATVDEEAVGVLAIRDELSALDYNLYATPFGPTNAGIAAVNAAVETEQFDRAVALGTCALNRVGAADLAGAVPARPGHRAQRTRPRRSRGGSAADRGTHRARVAALPHTGQVDGA